MLNIHTLVLGDYQVNCYIVHDSGANRCVLLDPGYEPETILAKLRELRLTLDAILLTHGHFDHVGAVKALVAATNCTLWMHRSDWAIASTPQTDFLYPLVNDGFTEGHFCGEGDRVRAAGLEFTVLSTPGHTQGSVCYTCENALFSGDTLFAGSMGRTDLAGASGAAMAQSLLRLKSLDKNYTVYPGHGGSTTLEKEKRYNPYLR